MVFFHLQQIFTAGRGDHVLSCGHDKRVGDILAISDNDEIIGETRAVVDCVEYSQSYDAAVAKIDNINYTKSVDYGGRQLHLAATPVDPVKGATVQRFPPLSMASQAKILHTDYNIQDNVYGCIALATDNGEAFHVAGESGLLVTSLPSAEFPERVDPIGMLIGIQRFERMDDGRETCYSVAISITKNFEKLKRDEYCSGGQIIF